MSAALVDRAPAAAPAPARPHAGVVYLVGAGPGDPELITRRGWRCLRRAEALLYDRLVHPELVAAAPATAERIDCGKAPGRAALGQEAIVERMVALARAGRVVVRLKGGDPYVFGRGGEEGLALTAAGVRWQVVPGVSSALAVPAVAGIPLTHRGVAASFAVVTGHRAAGAGGPPHPLPVADTVVVLMGVAELPALVERFLAQGWPAATPAALVERGTLPGERVVEGDLAAIARRAAEAGVHPPAALVVGEVVRFRSRLAPGCEPAPWEEQAWLEA